MKDDENLYRESFEKCEKATTINPDDYDAFNNLGNALSDLAKMKDDENLYRESFEKYEKAITIQTRFRR